MKNALLSFSAIAVILLSPAFSRAETYTIDQAHSSVEFSVRHFFTKVSGRFNEFEGTIDYKPESPESSSVQATIQTASIDTANEKRDKHLRTGDFFDVEKHPTMTFESTKIERTGEKTGKLTGNLTMHGVTKEVTLDVEFLGKGKGMQGETITGWIAKMTLDRKEFGLDWGKVVEGTAVVGDEVDVTINVEAHAADAAKTASRN